MRESKSVLFVVGSIDTPRIRKYPKDKLTAEWAWECDECVVARIASLNKSILEYQKERQRTD